MVRVDDVSRRRRRAATVDQIVARVVAELAPQKVILFGSAARGETTEGSDLDLLVVVPAPGDTVTAMSRAYKALRTLPGRPPVDVLVFTSEDLDRWANVVGHVINEALVEGRVVYDAA